MFAVPSLNVWKVELERLGEEKQEATLQQDNLQRRLKDAEDIMARAQRSNQKEIAHMSGLSAQKEQVADMTGNLTGYARGVQ